jgi:CRP/FNR family transcriptional regulator, cyclic AMP receptor protein
VTAPTQPAQINQRAVRRVPSGAKQNGSTTASSRDSPLPVCELLREDPELAAAVPGPRRRDAFRRCTAPLLTITARNSHALSALEDRPGGLGFLILTGLVVRRVWIGGRSGPELLGEGDLLGPRGDCQWPLLPQASDWSIVEPLRVAVLDSHFVEHRLRRYPELAPALAVRAARRTENLGVNLAIVGHPRVETRIHMLLWHLAGRWGRVRAGAVVLPLRLTHSLLAELVAARRPTVTTALASLAHSGLIRTTRGEWMLFGQPPSDTRALGVLHTENDAQHAHAGAHRR